MRSSEPPWDPRGHEQAKELARVPLGQFVPAISRPLLRKPGPQVKPQRFQPDLETPCTRWGWPAPSSWCSGPLTPRTPSPALTSPKTGRTSVDRHWDRGCLLTGSADCKSKTPWVSGGGGVVRTGVPCPHPVSGLLGRRNLWEHQPGRGATPQLPPGQLTGPTLPACARGRPGGPDLLGAMQGSALVQLAVRARPDGGGERPDGALLSVLSIAVTAEEGKVTRALGFRGAPSTCLLASPLPRPPHSPKCQVGSCPGRRGQVMTQVPVNWPPQPCPEQGPRGTS